MSGVQRDRAAEPGGRAEPGRAAVVARGFPQFPPRRGRGTRGDTWWGRAWTKAVEDTSLDQGRLARGRTYARTGRVGPITVAPGQISAPVYGTAAEPYQSLVTVERLSDADWERFLDEVASRAGHIAALLDREMPHELVRAAADTGVRLLPTVGDLEPECTCLDWGYPCKHAAALCYQVGWLLDRDPFVLLLMRGRDQSELLDELQRRNAPGAVGDAGMPGAATAGGAAGARRGVPAAEAYRAVPGELPAIPDLPDGPVPDPALPAGDGVDPVALRLLVENAAVRARELLAGAAADLTVAQDTVRIAAYHPDEFAPPALVREIAAWRQGGVAGLETLQTDWSPPRHELARARAALTENWDGEPPLRTWRNRWTVGGVQLRYGRDGRWYPYRRRGNEWWPAGTPERDPATVLSELLGA